MSINKPNYDVVLNGFPGRIPRGFLGWSTTTLVNSVEGVAVFDTGSHGDRPGLLKGLADRGLSPADISTVVLSHLHFDHIANIECFPDAEIMIHEESLAYYERAGRADIAISRDLVEALLRRKRLTIVSGELDILEGVRMIETPGHCGGHTSLVLNVEGRVVVLAQDAIKHRGEIETMQSIGAFDPVAATLSIRRIVRIADIIVPGHDVPMLMRSGRPEPVTTLSADIEISINGTQHHIEYRHVRPIL